MPFKKLKKPELQELKEEENLESKVMYLSTAKHQLDQEIELLRAHIEKFKFFSDELEESLNYFENGRSIPNDKRLLIPITSALSLGGYLRDKNTFYIDIGCNYFIEMTKVQSMNYFNRRIEQNKKHEEQYKVLLEEKINLRENINYVLTNKRQALFVNSMISKASKKKNDR